MQNATFFAKCNALCYTLHVCTVYFAVISLLCLIIRLFFASHVSPLLVTTYEHFGRVHPNLVPRFFLIFGTKNAWVVDKQFRIIIQMYYPSLPDSICLFLDAPFVLCASYSCSTLSNIIFAPQGLQILIVPCFL